eukprot:10000_1
MKPSMVGAFTAFLFENIPWVGQQVKNNTVTISLQRYHTRRIISKLDGRKLQFCTLNDISHSCIGIYIARYKSLISHVQPKVVEFHRVKGSQTYSVEPLNSLDIPYGLRLKFPERNRDALICKLQSNNCRYEWVAHLDYVLYTLDDGPKMCDHFSRPANSNSKMMHDFGYKHNDNADECITYFNFGIYFHYWRNGYENSVTPVYPTLKNELVNNIHSHIATSSYYELYDESYKILQNNVIRAQDIGINNKKFRIPP